MWQSVSSIVAGVIGILSVSLFKADKYSIKVRVTSSLIMTILVVVFVFAINFLMPQQSTVDNVELSKRIENVSHDLQNTSKELDSIQNELKNRIETVERLKEEAEIVENVISLSEEQVESIRKTLNLEINRNKTKDSWMSIASNVFFMILGAIVSYYINEFLKKRKRKSIPQGEIISG